MSPDNDSEETDLLSQYNKALDKHPLVTKSITAAVVQGLGAALASAITSYGRTSNNGTSQKLRSKRAAINWVDVIAFALHGGLVNGPIGHYWFEWLSKHGPKSSFHSMLVDQLLVQPPLLAFMFIFLDATRAAISEIRPSFGRTLNSVGPTILNSWRFWPIAVLCTFRYLKRKHYTVALNLCSLAWTVYLSRVGVTKKIEAVPQKS